VERGIQSREVRILFGNQAGGLVVRRLTMRNANPNITSEKSISVATEDPRGNEVSEAGQRRPSNASTPYVNGFNGLLIRMQPDAPANGNRAPDNSHSGIKNRLTIP